MTPEAGQSAEFALWNKSKLIIPLLTAHLIRTHEGYSFDVVSNGIPLVAVRSFELTFWGVPADPSHDAMRGRYCHNAATITNSVTESLTCPFPGEREGGGVPAGLTPVPFLSMPTNCTAGPESAALRADSWQEPGGVGINGQYFGYVEATTLFPAVTGCDLLQFKPGTGVTLEPDTEQADAPVGLGVTLKIPLTETPRTNTTPLLRDTSVTLPEGMSVVAGDRGRDPGM